MISYGGVVLLALCVGSIHPSISLTIRFHPLTLEQSLVNTRFLVVEKSKHVSMRFRPWTYPFLPRLTRLGACPTEQSAITNTTITHPCSLSPQLRNPGNSLRRHGYHIRRPLSSAVEGVYEPPTLTIIIYHGLVEGLDMKNVVL